MSAYWDSSALVEAVFEPRLNDRLRHERGVTRPHSLAEVFSTLTGNPVTRIPADDAALVVETLARSLDFIDLDAAETTAAMKRARALGVRGGRIHDLLHAVAADKSPADRILTLDQQDFLGLTRLPIEIA